jgi:putative Mg2+ transporter-C (MgtC) family protein
MNDINITVIHLLGAIFAGGLIGFERSFHARPAGFRTHTLVCLASSLLMLVTLYQPSIAVEAIKTDPTRMAQGIMTGIGFLGAGVIFKEGLTVRGLTTAASIWITAAIGIMIGIGFYFPAILATVLTVIVLSFFRWIEAKMPTQSYAHFLVSYRREQSVDEGEIRAMLTKHKFRCFNFTYRLADEGKNFEYRMILLYQNSISIHDLAMTLKQNTDVVNFKISPASD